jgi:hypothetical protein
MKKIALIVCLVGTLLSCGSSAVVKESTATIKGDWILSSIEYPGNEENLQITLLNDTSAECLENSTWNFISRNNTGSYEPGKIMCGTQPRFFRWSVTEVNSTAGNYDLMLKPTDQDYKSSTDQGFRINLTNLTENRMTWEQTVTFEGAPFTIRMNFNKQ